MTATAYRHPAALAYVAAHPTTATGKRTNDYNMSVTLEAYELIAPTSIRASATPDHRVFGLRFTLDCHYCGVRMSLEGAKLDHADGNGTQHVNTRTGARYVGSALAARVARNDADGFHVVACCGSCNEEKSDRIGYAEMMALHTADREWNGSRPR